MSPYSIFALVALVGIPQLANAQGPNDEKECRILQESLGRNERVLEQDGFLRSILPSVKRIAETDPAKANKIELSALTRQFNHDRESVIAQSKVHPGIERFSEETEAVARTQAGLEPTAGLGRLTSVPKVVDLIVDMKKRGGVSPEKAINLEIVPRAIGGLAESETRESAVSILKKSWWSAAKAAHYDRVIGRLEDLNQARLDVEKLRGGPDYNVYVKYIDASLSVLTSAGYLERCLEHNAGSEALATCLTERRAIFTAALEFQASAMKDLDRANEVAGHDFFNRQRSLYRTREVMLEWALGCVNHRSQVVLTLRKPYQAEAGRVKTITLVPGGRGD